MHFSQIDEGFYVQDYIDLLYWLYTVWKYVECYGNLAYL